MLPSYLVICSCGFVQSQCDKVEQILLEKVLPVVLRDVPESQREEVKAHLLADSLTSLKLDEEGKIGYTLKPAGCGWWALRHDHTFTEAVERVVMEAGDADSNATVVGALVGARVGYSALPTKWLVALPHKKWLDSIVERFVVKMALH
eukprot:NODE_1174_length_1851_cov_121.222222_g1114_i0.p1 GENE.NODE_1174_length_1851_cov_121.222222_g1114_i0~~NODE_1174_length_1851_cov_121.222222_g1114_i0.p1  ORF type:complete len:148 (+),score=24.04 NODE_1174_length_1851_cov_121.222222_g1114_i0:1238-1681(+)